MHVENGFLLNVEGHRDAFPAQGKIQTGYLRGLPNLVCNLGGNPNKVLERYGVDPLAFDNPDLHIDCLAAVNLLEHCSTTLDAPLFGMRLAELQAPDVFGCAMALARSAPSLRQALQSLVDYVPVTASPECEVEMVTARDLVELRWRTHTGLGETEQVNYHGLLLFMKTLEMLSRDHFRPRYANLTFKITQEERDAIEERLGCKVYGKAQHHAIAFDAELLDYPVATSNKMLFDLLGSYLDKLRASSKASWAQQIEAYVRGAISSGDCTVDGCAERLGTSARTLQKRLMRMGAKFSDIVQNERVKLAKQALVWSDASLDEIAFQLGYAEQTSFGRAFKRATGMTPQAFRSVESRRAALHSERSRPH